MFVITCFALGAGLMALLGEPCNLVPIVPGDSLTSFRQMGLDICVPLSSSHFRDIRRVAYALGSVSFDWSISRSSLWSKSAASC